MSKRAIQLLVAALVLMTLLNMTLLVTIWIRPTASDPSLQPEGPPAVGMAPGLMDPQMRRGEWGEHGPEIRQQIMARFLTNQIGLDEAQLAQFQMIRDEQMTRTRQLERTLRNQRAALMASLSGLDAESLAEDPRLAEIRATTAELERLNLDYLLRLRSVCREDQLEAFDRLIPRMLLGAARPAEGEGSNRPGPGDRPGRPQRAGGMRPAIQP